MNPTEGQGRTYHSIYSEIERLSSKVNDATKPVGFENYLLKVNEIQRQYIREFHQMTPTERTDSSLLINMVLNQMHGRVDVFRAKAMNREIKPKE